jgi:hypothetical protein
MKFCTKTQDLLKAYNKAINDLLIELLERIGYSDVCFYKYENEKLKGCKSFEGTEFQAGDGSDDGGIFSGYWVGGDIGGILVIDEEWFIKPEILKQAVELKTANIKDVFDYYDYEFEESEKKRTVLTFKNWFKN